MGRGRVGSYPARSVREPSRNWCRSDCCLAYFSAGDAVETTPDFNHRPSGGSALQGLARLKPRNDGFYPFTAAPRISGHY